MENYPYKLWIWIFSFKFSSMFHLQDIFLIYAYLSCVSFAYNSVPFGRKSYDPCFDPSVYDLM